jgi:hypothetical protein
VPHNQKKILKNHIGTKSLSAEYVHKYSCLLSNTVTITKDVGRWRSCEKIHNLNMAHKHHLLTFPLIEYFLLDSIVYNFKIEGLVIFLKNEVLERLRSVVLATKGALVQTGCKIEQRWTRTSRTNSNSSKSSYQFSKIQRISP